MRKARDTEPKFSDTAEMQPERNPGSASHVSPSPGQVETLKVGKGIWRKYDATHGLPGGVGCLLQDRQGYLWLGVLVEFTSGIGLCRYDGAEFITYTTDDGLAGNRVMSIYEDRQGRLWLATTSGVSCYDGKQFTSYTTENGLAGNFVFGICEDRRGRLWFCTREGGLSCYDGQRFTNYTRENGLPYYDASSICQDSQGCVWFGSKGVEPSGVARFDGQRFITYTAADGLANDQIHTMCADHKGRLWFGTDNGLSMFDGQGFTNYTTADGLGDNHIWAIYEDRQGTLWFGFEYAGGGVSRLVGFEQSQWDKPYFITYTTDDGLSDNMVYDITQDREGRFWFAHSHSGVTCFDPETIKTLTKTPVSQSLIQDRKGQLWFSNSSELCHIHPKSRIFDVGQGIARKLTDDPAQDDYQRHLASNDSDASSDQQKSQSFNSIVFSLMEDSRGGFWVGTQEDGLYHYESPDAVWDNSGEHFTTQNGLSIDVVLSLLETRDGTLWAGTWGDGWVHGVTACLCKFNGEAFESIPTPHPVIHRLFEDGQGRIWMGGWAGGGLSCYDGKTIVTYTVENGLPHNSVVSIVEDNSGKLWIGTLQGLCCFDGKSFSICGREQGVSSLCHQWSVKDTTGQLWFGTLMGGIYRYDGRHFQQLTEADGLPSNCVTGLIPQADGSMIIGTYHGIIHYHPTARIPPGVEIREVVANEVYQNRTELELTTTGANLISISYHGLSLATNKMRYSYILEGHDAEWQETWERQVRYENLPVGEYTFRVIAINRDLVTSETPAILKLTVRPDPRDVRINNLQTEVKNLRREAGLKHDFHNIIGQSAAIKQVHALMERAIDSGLAVLIIGETGTGKELVAKAIHYNSPRKDGPLKDLNCGAVSRELISSTLFGHRKGAFTGATEDRIGLFEAASGGTLLLDEIGEMPEDAQIHLLRVLEEHKVQRLGEYTARDVDVRIIAMTNRDLDQAVRDNRLRKDLYYRLSVFPIYVPALRDRAEDIPLLADHFLKMACDQQSKKLEGSGPGVIDMLKGYSWPGNVRELEHEIYRAVALAEDGAHVQTYHFSSQLTQGESLIQGIISEKIGLSASLELLQRRLIENALKECNGNRTQAARILDTQRPNLVRIMKRLGIE